MDALRSAGFDNIQEVGENHAVPGSTLLLAQWMRGAADIAGIDASELLDNGVSAATRSVIVVGRAKPSKTGFEYLLSRSLGDFGIASIVTASNGAPKEREDSKAGRWTTTHRCRVSRLAAGLSQGDNGSSDGIEIVLALDATGARANAPMRVMLERLSNLSSLLQSLGNRAARLWIIAEGGARGIADLGPACPVQTGVWSFMRTAINEFAKLDIRLVDFADGMSPGAKAARLAGLMSLPGNARELVLTTEGMVVLEVRRGKPAGLADQRAPASVGEDNAVVLQQRERGNLEELAWVLKQRRAPGEHEVEIQVAASGLNFRDVMWSLGLLPEEALEDGFAGPTIGLECAGRVVRVGRHVAGLCVGDPVIAIAPARSRRMSRLRRGL